MSQNPSRQSKKKKKKKRKRKHFIFLFLSFKESISVGQFQIKHFEYWKSLNKEEEK